MNDGGLEQGLQYVEAELERGVSKDEIRKQLLASGWSVEDVETVIRRTEQRGDFHSEYESSNDTQPYFQNQDVGNASGTNTWDAMANDSAASIPVASDPATGLDQTGLDENGLGGTGQAYYQTPAQVDAGWNPKAFFFFITGALCFLLAVGLAAAVVAGLIQARAIRFVVGLLLFGGWLWKSGVEARNKTPNK